MFDLIELERLAKNRKEAREELELAEAKMEKVEILQRRILFCGTLLIIVATCVATTFTYPVISKVGGFTCAVVASVVSIFFGLFQFVANGEMNMAEKELKKAIPKERNAAEESFVYITKCFT